MKAFDLYTCWRLNTQFDAYLLSSQFPTPSIVCLSRYIGQAYASENSMQTLKHISEIHILLLPPFLTDMVGGLPPSSASTRIEIVILACVYRLNMTPSAAARTVAATSAASGVYMLLSLMQLSTNPTEQTTERGGAISALPLLPCRPSCGSCNDAVAPSLVLTLQLLPTLLAVLQLVTGWGPYTRAMTFVHPRETTARPSQFVGHPAAPAAAAAPSCAPGTTALSSIEEAGGTDVRQRNWRASCTSRPSARKPHGESVSALYI